MGVSVMTCTLLWAAISAAYLLYCINGGITDDRTSSLTKVLEVKAAPHHCRRHLQQRVHCVDNILGCFLGALPCT